jgi:hypothetical protein
LLLHKIKYILPVFFLIIACTNNPLKIIKTECGSSVSMNGTIANASLVYTFKLCTHCRSLKDICNYIYFQGDTLCFSIQCNQNIESATVTAYFENPTTHTTYKAERIEKVTTTVYGFSLIGSLLEKIFRDDICNTHNVKTFKLPFVIHVTIEKQNQKVHHTFSDTFYVHFVD